MYQLQFRTTPEERQAIIQQAQAMAEWHNNQGMMNGQPGTEDQTDQQQ